MKSQQELIALLNDLIRQKDLMIEQKDSIISYQAKTIAALMKSTKQKIVMPVPVINLN